MSRLAPAVAAFVTVAVASFALAPPAAAADLPACTPGADLVWILGADVASDARLTVDCNMTVDLAGFTLDVGGVTLLTGASLTVRDSVGTGELLAERTVGGAGIDVPVSARLTVDGGSISALGVGGRAAIGGTPDAGEIVINGGSVSARSQNRPMSPAGAGIGGAFGGNGGHVTINGGTVLAEGAAYFGDTTIYSTPAIGSGSFAEHGGSLTVNGGSLTALGGDAYYHSATIGGGYHSAGSDVVIGEDAVVSVTGGTGFAWGLFGAGIGGTGFGSLRVAGDLHLPSGTLVIPAGAAVVVDATGRILGSEDAPTQGATVSGEGLIQNDGVIALDASLVGVEVTRNAFDVDFVAPGGGVEASATVFAPSFATGFRSLPAPPEGGGWATAPDGSGTWFTADTTLTPGASAPTPVTVYGITGFEAFATDVGSCVDGTTIALTGDLASDELAAGELTIPCDLTLDLDGHTLEFDHADVLPGSHLTIADTAGGGELTAETVGDDAGIGVPEGAALTVEAGAVVARARSGAGIGGDFTRFVGERAGSVTVTGGSVTAAASGGGAGIGGGLGYNGGGAGGAVLITGGTVAADGGETAPGIGGGGPWVPNSDAFYPGGAGADVRIEGGVVTVTGASGIGSGAGSSGGPTAIVGGTVTVSAWRTAFGGTHAFGSLLIGSGATVHVPSGAFMIQDSTPDAAEVTIESGGRLLGSAADPTVGAPLTGDGQIDNGGVIALATDLVHVAVRDHNHLLTFEGGTLDPAPVRVFADTVAAGYRTLPPLTAPDAWNTAADGSGDWFTAETALIGDTVLYAVTDATLTLTADAGSVDQGGSLTFAVTGVDRNGDPVDVTGVVLTSSVATDEIDGLTVTFPHASPHTITATLGTASTTLTVEVIPTAAPAPLPPTGGTLDLAALPLAAALLLLGALSLTRALFRRHPTP